METGLDLINHHSPSSLHLAQGSIAKYAAQKLGGFSGPVGQAAFRGTAVEDELVNWLKTTTPETDTLPSSEPAVERFKELCEKAGVDYDDKNVAQVAGMFQMACDAFLQSGFLGKPFEAQKKHVHEFPGLTKPVLGYSDITYPEEGITIDLKTTMACPSSVKPQHARQVSFYLHNTNNSGKLLYVTPKRFEWYNLENPAEHLKSLVQIACRLERWLQLGDAETLLSTVIPDTEHFYWSAPADRQFAWEQFGI